MPKVYQNELPLRADLTFTQDPSMAYIYSTFGCVYDSRGEPAAYVRDSLNDNFSEGLQCLRQLEASGIQVARRLPFIAGKGVEMLLVEYLDGPLLDRAQLFPAVMRRHALRLGSYYVMCFMRNQPFLTDIIEPFQYKVKGGRPTLIDLDMHTESRETCDNIARLIRGHIQEAFEAYAHFMPRNKVDSFYGEMKSLKEQVVC